MIKKIGEWFRYFMYGRYGSDKLSIVLMVVGVALSLISGFANSSYLGLLAYIPLILAIYRMYSRNIFKRKQENQKFLALIARVKDRSNRYFACPRCHRTVRVPKGKGKIMIKCPVCGERFSKKS